MDYWIGKEITIIKPVEGLKVGETYKIGTPPKGFTNGCINVYVNGIKVPFFKCDPMLYTLANTEILHPKIPIVKSRRTR